MIIHSIITYIDISKHKKIPKMIKKYEFMLHIYNKCFEKFPSSHPSIVTLINNIVLN